MDNPDKSRDLKRKNKLSDNLNKYRKITDNIKNIEVEVVLRYKIKT